MVKRVDNSPPDIDAPLSWMVSRGPVHLGRGVGSILCGPNGLVLKYEEAVCHRLKRGGLDR